MSPGAANHCKERKDAAAAAPFGLGGQLGSRTRRRWRRARAYECGGQRGAALGGPRASGPAILLRLRLQLAARSLASAHHRARASARSAVRPHGTERVSQSGETRGSEKESYCKPRVSSGCRHRQKHLVVSRAAQPRVLRRRRTLPHAHTHRQAPRTPALPTPMQLLATAALQQQREPRASRDTEQDLSASAAAGLWSPWS